MYVRALGMGRTLRDTILHRTRQPYEDAWVQARLFASRVARALSGAAALHFLLYILLLVWYSCV